jgi:hypothetical protein
MTGRFGDMTGSQLSAILWKLDQGWIDDWADLCEYALCDDTLMSLYASRANRVLQASWKVKPNEFGGNDAKLAAEFCHEQMGRLRNFTDALRYMMHAAAVGLSASEVEIDAYQAPTGQVTYYPRKIHFRHPHRFRYDDQWKPRLWDQGKRITQDLGWGRPLDPRKWLVYQHYEIVGYPNVSGFMRAAIWVWLFRRWADKFGIQSLERFGNPYLYAKVPKNTPLPNRERIRQDLQDLSNDHAGVIEDGIEILSMAGMSAQSDSLHGAFMDRYEKRLARLILGASDAADPGENGSNAAVATRTGAMTDPRMVTDGVAIGEAWASQIFAWMLEFNRHRFGGKAMPVPQFVALTATDEVQTDKQDLAEQSGGLPPSGGNGGGPGSGGMTPEVGGSDEPPHAMLDAGRLDSTLEAESVDLAFNPSQSRGPDGRWTAGPGGPKLAKAKNNKTTPSSTNEDKQKIAERTAKLKERARKAAATRAANKAKRQAAESTGHIADTQKDSEQPSKKKNADAKAAAKQKLKQQAAAAKQQKAAEKAAAAKQKADERLRKAAEKLKAQQAKAAASKKPAAPEKDSSSPVGKPIDQVKVDTVSKVFGHPLSSTDINRMNGVGKLPPGYDVQVRSVRHMSNANSNYSGNASPGCYLTANVTHNGEVVGNIGRTYYRDKATGKLVVMHDEFFLEEKHQGSGVGKAVFNSQVDAYEKLGVSEVKLKATDVGKYVWSKAGFQWTNQKQLDGVKSKLKERLTQEYGAGPALAIMARVESGEHISGITIDGKRIGKEFLVGLSENEVSSFGGGSEYIEMSQAPSKIKRL